MKNALGWIVYGGYRLGFLGVEGGYRDLGSVSTGNSGNIWESKLTAWDIAAKGHLDIGPLCTQRVKRAPHFIKTQCPLEDRALRKTPLICCGVLVQELI